MNTAPTNESRSSGPASSPAWEGTDLPQDRRWYQPKHEADEMADTNGWDPFPTEPVPPELLGALDAPADGDADEGTSSDEPPTTTPTSHVQDDGPPQTTEAFDDYDDPGAGTTTWPSSLAPPETGSLVRPYTKTGGRTRPDYDLAIESLVSTNESGKLPHAAASTEQRSICDLCGETRSVAEVAAHLQLPLGVVKVLIGDLAGMGLVQIHSNDMESGNRPSVEIMERVLSGLHRL